MTPEFTARCLLRWALDETIIRIPRKLQRPAAWRWDDDHQQLVAMTDDGEYRYHTALTHGRWKVRQAVLTVTDFNSKVKWEADIPADVYEQAKGGAAGVTGPLKDGWGEAVTPERQLADDILAELIRARTKFPGKNVTFAALVEEVGELATATFEESAERVRKEAVQVAVMAMRMVLDGDQTFNDWRSSKGLDHLDPAARAALSQPDSGEGAA